ncbi:MAG: hypothetical protein HGA74_14590 [Deltaproteobacteria bacterium]|nr:hypothetical protein [Deltaproteobacteria bacterium]NTV58490.1 hypothetical protein [Deltaproteobacteria bacterium]
MEQCLSQVGYHEYHPMLVVTRLGLSNARHSEFIATWHRQIKESHLHTYTSEAG